MNDLRKDSPSFHRNIEPITSILANRFAEVEGTVLEVGSGSGQHVASFAATFPHLTFQPTDIEPENLASIDAWIRHSDAANVLKAKLFDVIIDSWPTEITTTKYAALLSFNVIHIAPWEVTLGLFRVANEQLTDSGQIVLYGPFRVNGEQTSPSNEEFEKWLKGKDSSFGVRDIADLKEEAKRSGFKLSETIPMPANNFIQVFTRT